MCFVQVECLPVCLRCVCFDCDVSCDVARFVVMLWLWCDCVFSLHALLWLMLLCLCAVLWFVFDVCFVVVGCVFLCHLFVCFVCGLFRGGV